MNNTMPRDYSFIAPIYDHIFNKPLSEGHREIGRLIKRETRNKKIKILEVGVGSGLTFDYLPSGINFTGVDVNQKMLSIAHKKAQQTENSNITLRIMDAHKMKFTANSFDLVTAPSVITALENPIKGIKELVRVTKPGGKIAIIANLRARRSLKSEIVRLFDPLTKKMLGFRVDLDIDTFDQFKELQLIEQKQVNNLFGMSLSTYLLFKKK